MSEGSIAPFCGAANNAQATEALSPHKAVGEVKTSTWAIRTRQPP